MGGVRQQGFHMGGVPQQGFHIFALDPHSVHLDLPPSIHLQSAIYKVLFLMEACFAHDFSKFV
ncbi:hypothetical protein DPMN_086830 [Dreissena polymorpha]|uniref:Uncharacterized protein n=1 Tax=Dreissena polymorpha TaxID=45954 RepID=A0A9D4KT16_DREPO|nr:hypothetical protein DPMN_086830 [Dreissena polymorpha]